MDANAGTTVRRRGRGQHGRPAGSAPRIVFVYAVVAGAWILTSDILSRAMTIDPDLLTTVGIAKGVLFVVVTSTLLYVQIRSYLTHLQASGDQLHESERRFRRVIDVSPVPMAMSGTDGNVTLTSDAFVKVLGYTPEDIPTISEWWSKACPDPAYRGSPRRGAPSRSGP